MDWSLVKCFLLGLTLSLQINGHYGCFQKERLALLDFKASVQSIEGDNEGLLLPSWTNASSSDCCRWERVTCSPSTARVIMLSLNETRPDYDDRSGWYLNISTFLHFKELRSLNLSYNAIAELTVNIEDSKGLSKLNKLEHLDLSWNYLDSEVFKVLGQFSALRSLYLHDNVIEGSLSDQADLAALANLEVLNLRFNELNGTLPIHYLAKFGRLKILDLSWNGFTGSIPSNIENLSSLKALTLSKNFLTGEIPSEAGKLSQIHALNLSQNQLTGSIPRTLAKLSRIESLDLSYNSLNGTIPQELTHLRFLQFFSVAYNNLLGRIPNIRPQFGKFDSSSYQGNPFLCGLPLVKSCRPFT